MEISKKNSDFCRLCDRKMDKMYSIFDKNEDGLQIIRLISNCLPIIVYRTDPLSKQICVACNNNLNTLYKFKKTSEETAQKHREDLKNNQNNDCIKLFIGCDSNSEAVPVKSDSSTSTEDIPILCNNCKVKITDSSLVKNEVELCAELHQVIANSLSTNKINNDIEPEKLPRNRPKGQAFYQELDDSLCSSLTELTNNTESWNECNSDYSCNEEPKPKRRKIDKNYDFLKNDSEIRYYPLSLTKLCLNVINERNLGNDLNESFDFYQKMIQVYCKYCNEAFRNSKLLALHQLSHINIDVGDRIDCPVLWNKSRNDSIIRNKWLNNSLTNGSQEEEEEDEMIEEVFECESENISEQNLLIPIGNDLEPVMKNSIEGEVILQLGKPMVNGIPLTDYTKDERKLFYKSFRIGGVNKKFCPLCRYSFKDNWAIESHYFSSACYYTCRYCGMRFNKQRHRFDEHVKEHTDNNDELSTKIYAASKLSNIVPKVIQPDKVKKVIAQQDQQDIKVQPIKMKNLMQQKRILPKPTIKKEIPEMPKLKQAKLTKPENPVNRSQAYFCRKCYKVFFKLDEFNIHSKKCDHNQFPPSRNRSMTELSPTGRPLRNCVKEMAKNKKEAEIEDEVITPTKTTNQNYICFICNTIFPTVYSRNSHMRIHKGEVRTQPQKNKPLQVYSNPKRNSLPKIKKEPLEPEVEIHESGQKLNNSSNGVGSVSITPILKNPNQKATINPNIMKLVQNNPHLTIKANMNQSPSSSTTSCNNGNNVQNTNGNATGGDSDKFYKCSSCWEGFSNKSNLYFHKKNQCQGSKYPCPFCKKRFGSESAYSSHIFFSHPE